jgi:hypothetical protein
MSTPDPFTILGLPPDPNLTDEEVRAAWRQIAAATHPDRADGSDPARYAAASAAYAMLRAPWPRAEAYGDLVAAGLIPPAQPAAPSAPDLTPAVVAPPGPAPVVPAVPVPPPARRPARPQARSLPARIRHGRPGVLAIRILGAAGIGAAVWFSGAGTPAVAGVLAGIVTWLALTARADLAPPPGR